MEGEALFWGERLGKGEETNGVKRINEDTKDFGAWYKMKVHCAFAYHCLVLMCCVRR